MIIISGNSRCVFKAAGWLRKRTSIPYSERLDDEFTQYFNCRVIRNNVDFHIEFDNDADATMFRLKWS
jgi:hypothetical protein